MDRADHNETRDVERDMARSGRYVLSQSERRERRSRLSGLNRWGEHGLWHKGSETLKKIPIIGETALQPMTTFLDTAVNLYSTTHDDQGHSHYGQAIKDVAGQAFKDVAGQAINFF
jgi:hypothetical protein